MIILHLSVEPSAHLTVLIRRNASIMWAVRCRTCNYAGVWRGSEQEANDDGDDHRRLTPLPLPTLWRICHLRSPMRSAELGATNRKLQIGEVFVYAENTPEGWFKRYYTATALNSAPPSIRPLIQAITPVWKMWTP